jgi:hypothetical protein
VVIEAGVSAAGDVVDAKTLWICMDPYQDDIRLIRISCF